jgi:hypothetical protein
MVVVVVVVVGVWCVWGLALPLSDNEDISEEQGESLRWMIGADRKQAAFESLKEETAEREKTIQQAMEENKALKKRLASLTMPHSRSRASTATTGVCGSPT